MAKGLQHWIVPLTACALAGPVAAALSAPVPEAGAPLLVIAGSPLSLIEDAGGDWIGPTRAPFAALSHDGPDLPEKLREVGAWFVTDGRWIATICGVTT